jgi:alpha-L-arabinofuranosidase
VFLVNYAKEAMDIELELRSFGAIHALDHQLLHHDNLDIKNTFEHEYVKFAKGELPVIKDAIATIKLEPLSYHVLRFKY